MRLSVTRGRLLGHAEFILGFDGIALAVGELVTAVLLTIGCAAAVEDGVPSTVRSSTLPVEAVLVNGATPQESI